jgi:hypothetical protein
MDNICAAEGLQNAPYSVRGQLFRECEAMASYALASGMLLPEEVYEELSLIADGYDNATLQDIRRLVLLHSRLAQVVQPAKPHTLKLLQDDSCHHSFSRILGPLPSVRRIASGAAVFGAMFIAISLSPFINAETLQKDIYTTHGLELLAALIFLLSAAGLGASFNVLYTISQSLSEGNYDPRSESFSWISIALGLMAGLLLSEMMPSGYYQDTEVLAKPMIALLGGFSASLLHRVLGRLVETAGNLFEASSTERLRAQEQEWRLRAADQLRQERVQVTSALVDALGRVREGGSANEREDAIRSVLNRMNGRISTPGGRSSVRSDSASKPDVPRGARSGRPMPSPSAPPPSSIVEFTTARSPGDALPNISRIPVRGATDGRRQSGEQVGAMADAVSGAMPFGREATAQELRAHRAAAATDPDNDPVRMRHEEFLALQQRMAEHLSVLDIVIGMAPSEAAWSNLRAEIETTWRDMEQLIAENPHEAHRLGERLARLLKAADPFQETIHAANRAFGAVLPIPAAGRELAEALAEAAGRLEDAPFKRLIARLLDAPYTQELFTVADVSEEVAMAAIAATSTLSRVYAPEIDDRDIAFIAHLAQQPVEGEVEELWHAESRRFDTREQFVDAFAEFQAALLDQVVRAELSREDADTLLSTADALRVDPSAHVELDRLVTLIAELRWHHLDVTGLVGAAIAGLEKE